MIVITGATGRLGGRVLAALLERVPAEELGVSSTDPERAAGPAAQGVRVRLGDYDRPETLRESFEGADRVLLVSAPRIGEAAAIAHRTAIEAARAAGVGRILYTSHVGADALSPFPPASGHAATEVELRDSGVPFTALRNGFYADTPVRMAIAAAASGSGELRAPADAPVSWTTHDDLAPAIAALLLDPTLDQAAVNLTAGQAIDLDEVARIASRLTGRDIRRTVVADEDHRAELIAAGVPEMGAMMSLAIVQASRQRHFGIVDPALESLVGRPSQTFEQVLQAALDAAPLP
jgi:uncharacterized protein YbjT (DUF2867 family)